MSEQLKKDRGGKEDSSVNAKADTKQIKRTIKNLAGTVWLGAILNVLHRKNVRRYRITRVCACEHVTVCAHVFAGEYHIIPR